MKAMKKALALGLALAMVVTAVPVTSAQAASTAKLSASTVSVAAGTAKKQTKSVKVTTPSTWKSVKVKASSSDKKIATVKVSGKTVKVTAVKKGSAKVTVKVSAKKSGKTVKKTLTAKVKVINAGLRFVDPATEVVVGESVSLAAKKCPKAAVVTYKSSDDTIATVDADGKVTAVKAGKVTITATSDYGKEVTTDVTVKDAVAQLTAVKQTASNAFVATFSAKTPQYTKDDITVKAADNSAELAVKSVEYAADGVTATVTLFNSFADATAYKVACKDVTLDLTAKVGAVSSIAITTASAEQNVATPIEFTLFDKDGIDVTPSVSVDTTCMVSVSGSYSSAELSQASKAKITMVTVGDKADVTVLYNSNEKDAQDVTATQTINCIPAKAVKGETVFAVGGTTNAKSGCAKFYAGVSDKNVTVEEDATKSAVYFCAKKDAYEAVSYDSYEIESANDDVASASVVKDSGKYAVFSVTGNTVGSTQLNVKAIKNGQATYYTIPVVVTKKLEAVKMTVSVSRPVMSDVNDSDYFGEIEAQLFDQNNVKVEGGYTFELETTTGTKTINVDGNNPTPNKAKVTAEGADAKTYTIKVTGADNRTGKKFERRVTVQVKKLPAEAKDANTGAALSYQIEMNRTSLDQNSTDKHKLSSRLYATCNGLFAGYVRGNSGNITIANGNVYANDATLITGATVAAKFGTNTYSAGGDLISGGAFSAISSGANTFDAISTGATTLVWTPEGSSSLAREGTYTLEYKLYYDKDNKNVGSISASGAKSVSKTNVFTVTNSIVKPVVAVVTRNVSDVDDSTIIKEGLKTNVDMNNNDVETASSIIKLASDKKGTATTIKDGKKVVKYVVVEDNYDNGTWNFYMPINSTFKTN